MIVTPKGVMLTWGRVCMPYKTANISVHYRRELV